MVSREGRPCGKDDVGGDGSEVFEESLAGAFIVAGFSPAVFDEIADGVEGEGQKVHGGEQHGEAVFAMAEVVLQTIAVVFQNVEPFILDLPAGPGCGTDGSGVVLGEVEAGDKGALIGGLALGIGDGEGDKIDHHRVLAIAQRHGVEPAVADGQGLALKLFGDLKLVRPGPKRGGGLG